MVYKLVRVDTPQAYKIPLAFGTHMIGRGRFLHDNETDSRIAVTHAVLQVTPDTLSLTALQPTPCFYIKKNFDETHMLGQDDKVLLYHGDKFGLLPTNYWYEVIHCPEMNKTEKNTNFLDSDESSNSQNEMRIVPADEAKAESNVTSETSAANKMEKEICFDDQEKLAPLTSPMTLSFVQHTSFLADKQVSTEDLNDEPELSMIHEIRPPKRSETMDTSAVVTKKTKIGHVHGGDEGAGPSKEGDVTKVTLSKQTST